MMIKKNKGKRKEKQECRINHNNLLDLWRIQNGKCAITNMVMAHEPNNLRSASVDRIDSAKGYELDNIHLVCRWVNFAKSNHPLKTIVDILSEFKSA